MFKKHIQWLFSRMQHVKIARLQGQVSSLSGLIRTPSYLTRLAARVVKLTCVLILSGPWASAFADDANAFVDDTIVYAHVDSAVPVYQTIEELVPSERCWVDRVQEQTHYSAQGSRSGTLLGGLIGGAVGHAVGHGRSNKKLGAVVGGVIGASIGNQSDQRRSSSARTEVNYRDVERCEVRQVVQRRQELLGYDVHYSLDNRTYLARMSQKPGDKIRVALQVTPIE